ncbi:MAG: cob(I)yrinic acid a,c-diamide adenosyltransferase [Candidatus Nomurabacteria bacterium]|jgi:cob(I)alamin adenosyltransferase|nr:cob(I)yrinic acid a,c-diamide adenosyltransferase [Candidatus Nomurabacteria bacterium]
MAKSSIIVFTGDGKGKTEAALGLTLRALGADFRVLFVQFIKAWEVSEDRTLKSLSEIPSMKLTLKKGGKGFYAAGDLSAKNVSEEDHKKAANKAFDYILGEAKSGRYDLIVADEINNAVHDGLLKKDQLRELINICKDNVNLCLTGRNFPSDLLPLIDYATEMNKLKHPYDTKELAILGIDY